MLVMSAGRICSGPNEPIFARTITENLRERPENLSSDKSIRRSSRNSAGLTDILIVVVRYFGGIKLGTSGLIVAYREAASEAIAANEIIERQVEDEVHFGFEYPLMNEVMRIVKEEGPTIVSQIFDMDCEMTLRIRRSLMDNLKKRLSKVDGVHFINEE